MRIFSFVFFVYSAYCKDYIVDETSPVLKTYKHGTTIFEKEIIPATEKHEGTVIFLHHAASHGRGMRAWVNVVVGNFTFPHLKIIYPTALEHPYEFFEQEVLNIWFDRPDIYPNTTEDVETLLQSSEDLSQLIRDEIDAGIPEEKIIIGGFAMGAVMAMHMGYRFFPGIAGVFSLSGYLNYESAVYKELEEKKPTKLPPLLSCVGDRDEFVHWRWSRETLYKLKKYGVNGTIHIFQKVAHRISALEIDVLYRWINRRIPYNK